VYFFHIIILWVQKAKTTACFSGFNPKVISPSDKRKARLICLDALALMKFSSKPMKVKFKLAINQDNKGQSIIEFIFMLPLLIGLSTLLVKINTAIQISIVNQQYARAAVFRLTENSPNYPALYRSGGVTTGVPDGPRVRLIEQGSNQMVVGVSDNPAGGSGDYSPIATQQMIARKPSLTTHNAPQDESATTMGWVRIRNSVTLCTASFVYSDGPFLSETTNFSNYCGSKIVYDP
jgi:hypothetical protein